MAFQRKPSSWRRPGWTPQPDRDFAQGSRPSDVMNGRNPAQLGGLGQMSGGSASMFRPRQGQLRKHQSGMKIKPPTTQAQPGATASTGVKMTFSGDPTQLAQTFQALVNQTGTGVPRAGELPTEAPLRTINDPSWTPPVEQAVAPTPNPQASSPTAQTAPTAVPNFNDLQGYIDTIGGLDFIAEDAFSPYAGWQPRLPDMLQAKNALDQQFLSSVTAAGVNQEVAKSFTQAALARAVKDEMLDQERNREAMNERGMFNSGITSENAGLIRKDYLRSAEDAFADLIQELTGQASGVQAGYGSYIQDILGLATDEAGRLVDIPGAGATPTPTPAGTRPKARGSLTPNPKATTAHGYFGYTQQEWAALPERKRDELRRRFRRQT